jgi:hypothetical protein
MEPWILKLMGGLLDGTLGSMADFDGSRFRISRFIALDGIPEEIKRLMNLLM